MKIRILQGGRRIASLGAVAAAVTFASAAGAATSSASVLGLGLPTQTVLTSSSPSVSAGGTVTITASVRPDLLLLGSVTFTDTTNKVPLGSASTGLRCLFSFQPCVVTISVPASSLKVGANTISGTYSGLLSAPSTGTVTVVLNGQTTSIQGVTATYCSGFCNTGTQTSSDSTTSVSITASGGATASISDSFSTTPLPCSYSGAVGPGLGDVIVFSSTGLTGNKTIDYTVFGAAADNLFGSSYSDNQYGHVCYDSPVQFTTAGGSAATSDGQGGYYGILPGCTLPAGSEGGNATNPPCVDYISFNYTGGEGPDSWTDQIETTAADPRASN